MRWATCTCSLDAHFAAMGEERAHLERHSARTSKDATLHKAVAVAANCPKTRNHMSTEIA